jgi:hypothetical protein
MSAATNRLPDPSRSSGPQAVDEGESSTNKKSTHGGTGLSSSRKEDAVLPHARFFISRSKSSTVIKFDPPV